MADLISMLAAAAGAAADGGEVDPNFNQTVLLLHGDGTNGAQNNTFLDSSTNNFTITRNGNTTQGTFSPFSAPDGRWSNYFDGNDHLSLGTQVIPSSGDFTVEGWFNVDSYAARREIVFQCAPTTLVDGRLFIYVTTAGKLTCFVGGANRPGEMFTTTTVQVGNWYHFAFVRSGNDYTVYLNGVSEVTGSGTGTIAANNTLIARNSLSAVDTYWLGYLSNIRITTSAVYSGNFTPSSSPLADITNTVLLTCQANRFIDANTQVAAKTVTISGNPKVTPFSPFAPTAAYSPSVNGGSGYFDGSGDYLQSSITGLSGEFTIEFWSYRPAAGNNFFFTIGDASTSSAAEIYIGSSGTQLNYYSNSNVRINGGTPPAAGQWSYIAATRDSSDDVRLYVNGVQVGSSYNQSGTLSTDLRLGAEFFGGSITGVLNGYMGAFRISDTVRTVTSVPTAPFISDGNTVFLTNFTNAGIFDNTGKNNLETVADAQIDTTTKQFGTGSMEFDGTGDYLISNSSTTDLYAFGSGDFTIEMWVYFNTTTGSGVLYDSRGAEGAYPTIYRDGTTVKYYTNSADRITSGTVTTGTWYHLAVARSGTSTKMFIDGTQAGSTYTDSTVYLNASQRPFIGAAGVTGFVGTVGFNGFIDDLRITKGIARYTAAFTPPTKEFPNL